ncbi:MAG: hypothetical protein ABJV04_00570 [Aliiglaciecola sp.]|uniref:hypothetical protein n=1 Tax=Aliiglaciecola sp. TaxID=1872441 RepID=UPI003296B58A
MDIKILMEYFNDGYSERQIVKELELSEEEIDDFRIQVSKWIDKLEYEAQLIVRFANF